MNVEAETKAKAAAMTPKQRIAVAVKVISDKKAPFTQQARREYLIACGVSETEYLAALNQASGGALIAAAGL